MKPVSFTLTGSPRNLKPLDHLLPLGAVRGGWAHLGFGGELRDSEQGHDPVAAQRLGEGDESSSAGESGLHSPRHLGEGSKSRHSGLTGTEM